MRSIEILPGQELNTLIEVLPSWKGWLCTIAIDEEGNYVGNDGTSKSLSSAFDLKLLIALRSKADCIVTTGATARAEKYKSSRFAPIAFVSNNPSSLMQLPAFMAPGAHKNYVFSGIDNSRLFLEVTSRLKNLGHSVYLFEGGVKTLPILIRQAKEITLVTSLSNLQRPQEANSKSALEKLIGSGFDAREIDDFVTASNRVTVWKVSAQ